MLLTAKCQIQEVAGRLHKHPFAPRFLLPFSSLSTLVFLGWFSEVPVDWRGSLSTWLQKSGLPIWACAAPELSVEKNKSSSHPAPLQGEGTLGFKIKGWGNTDLFSEPSHVCSTFTTDSFPFNTISWKIPALFPPWLFHGCESPSKMKIMHIAVCLVVVALTCQVFSCTLTKQKLRTGTAFS